jgi:hypothetical protein
MRGHVSLSSKSPPDYQIVEILYKTSDGRSALCLGFHRGKNWFKSSGTSGIGDGQFMFKKMVTAPEPESWVALQDLNAENKINKE